MDVIVKMELITATRKRIDVLYDLMGKMNNVPKDYTETFKELYKNVGKSREMLQKFEFEYITAENPDDQHAKRLIQTGRYAQLAVYNPTIMILKTLGLIKKA